MSIEPHDAHHHPHPKNRHLAERFEHLLSVVMVIAVVLLAVGLIYGLMNTGSTPSWMP